MVDPNVLIGTVALVSLALLGWVGFVFTKHKEPWARGPLPALAAPVESAEADEDEEDDAHDEA